MSRPALRRARRLVLVAVVMLIVGPRLYGGQVPAQERQPSTPPPATGLIMGQVVDAATGKPVPGAVVTVTTAPAAATTGLTNQADLVQIAQAAGPAAPLRVVADSDGRFVFRDLAKGRYGFSATASGYLVGTNGQRRPGGPSVALELEAGEKLVDATLRLWKAASMTGTVLDEAGEPAVGMQVQSLRRVIVAGRTRWSPAGFGSSDDRGIYRFSNLMPGEYTVALPSTAATIPAAIMESYHDAMSSGDSASATAFMRGLMESGAPLPSGGGTRVGDHILQQSIFERGAPRPAPAENGKMSGYQTTYHPSATSASQITVITLGSGEERTGVDLHLRLVPTVKVSGTITGPEGPVPSIGVKLVPANLGDFNWELNFEAAVTATDASGAFTFLGVPSGAYTVKVLKTPRPEMVPMASEAIMVSSGSGGVSFATSMGPPSLPPPPTLPTQRSLWGSMPLSVGSADVAGVAVTLRTGFRVSGRVEFEGMRPPPSADQIQRMTVTLQALDPRTAGFVAPGRVSSDLQFRTTDFVPGRYLVTAGGAGTGWTLKSAMADGRDLADEPLEIGGEDVDGVVITFTDKQTELSGTVRNAQNQGDADADVVVFPANNQLWKDALSPRRARSVRTTKTGAFTIPGLPAGDYYVVAIASTTTREWQDPKFLESAAPMATRVTILDGDKKTQDLRTSRIR